MGWELVLALIGGAGTLISAATSIIATWKLVWPPRRRISYRVQFDGHVGKFPPDLKMAASLVRIVVQLVSVDKSTRKETMAEVVQNPSIALIRLRNDGRLDIERENITQKITFTFGRREVVGLDVITDDSALKEEVQGSGENILNFEKNTVTLPKMNLNKKVEFQLSAVLSGHDFGVTHSALIQGGKLVRDIGPKEPRRAVVRAILWSTVGIVVSVAILVFSLLVSKRSDSNGYACGSGGNITVLGSTAFAPVIEDLKPHYETICPSISLEVNPPDRQHSSHAGVVDLVSKGNSSREVRNTQLAMSDGAVPPNESPGLMEHPIAIIVFSVVVNKGTGIHSLTSDQLRQIYNGQIKNWSQVNGNNLPISIIGRNLDSGARSTFESKVLGENQKEPPASSRNCTDRIEGDKSPVIRCEQTSSSLLLEKVSNISGAIGYAETLAANESQASKYPNITEVQLNDRGASVALVKNGQYKFWAVEYFYSYDEPREGTRLFSFLDYLRSDRAKNIIQDNGHLPCRDTYQNPIDLCK